MDKFRIDSHKLTYHIPRVNDWIAGRLIYPIYMEVSPAGGCNHRCVFCGKDFMGYEPGFLDADLFMARMTEMGRLGVKSMMHAGEGEPLLHERLEDLVRHGKASGIDQAVNTNGVLFTPERAEQLLPHCEWIRASIDAGTAETHAALHRARPSDFDVIISNLAEAVRLRKAHGWKCTLGAQMLLLPENRDEAPVLARIARDIGLDYLIVKPYSQHPLSRTTRYSDIAYADDLALQEEAERFSTADFQVIFRVHAMRKWDEARHTYPHCRALPFWTYIDARGNVWGCSMYLNDSRFLYGNLNEQTFQEIWEGERRRESLRWVEEEMDATQCRVNCRMDEVNRFLWELRDPPAHVNFI